MSFKKITISLSFLNGAIFLGLFFYFYFSLTIKIPAPGGVLKEGVIGDLKILNPLWPETDNQRDLLNLLYAGLFRWKKNGKIEGDLIESYKILEKGRVFKMKLKENLFWSDGKPITVKDVIFTIKMVKDPAYKSPLAIFWHEVNAKEISQKEFLLELKTPYSFFLKNSTLKILPAHIFSKISPEELPLKLASFPKALFVSSGPFKFEKAVMDDEGKMKTIVLKRNENYHFKKPFLEKIEFKFYQNEEELIEEFLNKKIDSFSLSSPLNLSYFPNSFSRKIILPRYFALFFNLKDPLFKEKMIREALSLTVDREKIKEEVFKGQGEIVFSPLVPSYFGFKKPKESSPDFEKANSLLEKNGFSLKEGIREKIVQKRKEFKFKRFLKKGKRGEEVENLQRCLQFLGFFENEISGYFGRSTERALKKFQEEKGLQPDGILGKKTREKLNFLCKIPEKKLVLSFTIVSSDDQRLVKLSQILKKGFEKIGAKVELEIIPLLKIKEKIQTRDYQSLLFGQVLDMGPDLFPFWHSSQVESPGLNLSLFKNRKVDQLLERIRMAFNENEREKIFEELQSAILEERPAIFLINPIEFHIMRKEIKGVGKELKIADVSLRFLDISNWYLKEKRVLKWKD